MDAAMYDTFIRAAKPWAYRYPIEEAQGSYGSQAASDDHAQSRYVEMRSAEIADYFFDGLKKDAITEWYDNYDDSEQIPNVFPSIGFWNIINGCSGIAVAMATSVPQFNLREVNEALIKIIENPNVDFNEIYCAPDFSTGGTIINGNAVKESLKNGKGESVRLRAKLEYFPDNNMIKATQLPYGVYTNTIIGQIKELTDDNPSYGIERIVDHTKKIADIRIYLSKGTNPKRMIEKLYKDTSLENWFSINMIMLDHGRFPKVFSWRMACDAYITHIRECKYNIYKFDLDKSLARENIVEGLLLAAASIDEVISLIRSSSNPDEAAEKLTVRFNFNEPQVKAILAMKLSSLTRIDAIKLENEKEELLKKIEELRYLLNTPTALDAELIKILREVADKFGDERRTKIMNLVEDEVEEKPEIVEDSIAVMLFDNNMLRLVKVDDLQGGKRGRKGTNIRPPKNANLINTLYTTNLSTITAFTTGGRMYSFLLSSLEYGKDYSLYELISFQDDEKVVLLIDTTSFNSYHHLITVSKNGYIKKTKITNYNVLARHGTAAVKLEEGDQLVGVYLSMSDKDRIMVANNSGYYNYYEVGEIGATGRVTKGVKAIKLQPKEFVVAATLVKKDVRYRGILTISSSGRGKITELDGFSETTRATKGAAAMNLKDEQLAIVYAVPEDQTKIFVSANNKANLLEIDQVPVQARATVGVTIINLPASTTSIKVM